MQTTIINNKVKIIQGDDQIYRYIAINKSSIDLDTLEKMTKVGDEWNGKPKVPTRLFSKEDEAIKWLKEQMEKKSK